MISPQELIGVLRQYNPWWSGGRMVEVPGWRRAAFRELELWLFEPPAPRAVLLSGARQIGKTTLLLQAIESLLESGVPPQNIVYATLDHPLLKLAGLDAVLNLWQEFEPLAEGPEYLFIDEVQSVPDWQTWLKLQVDFKKNRRIFVTGSATPLAMEGQESGVGRWHTIRLATLSFFEYLQLRQVDVPQLPEVRSLRRLFDWTPSDFSKTGHAATVLVPHFNDYLMRGGFPQCAQVASVDMAQKLLREDIVDKVLKRDMTALFGVRRILELEQVFLYLCLHDGGLLDVQELCKSLRLNKPTVNNFLSLIEATHLIHRLPPHGYGKDVLRARYKVYLADAAIAPSVLLKGKAMLEDAAAMGRAVETAFFKHVYTRYYGPMSMGFSYWRSKKDEEVDIIVEHQDQLIPFEVKYSFQHTGLKELKGLLALCEKRNISRGYVITREPDDFEILETSTETNLLKIPAVLACYWLGQSELRTAKTDVDAG